MKLAGLLTLLVLQLSTALDAQPQGVPAPEKLKIQIVEGQAVVHNLRQRAASDLQVQITDAANRPVAGANVRFQSPVQGAGGTFAKGSTIANTTTDDRGRAVIRGFRPNTIAGKFNIGVSAAYEGETAQATITQFNVMVEKAQRKSATGKVVAILGVVGAAAAGGAYAAMHKSNSSTPAPPATPVPTIGISPGTGVAGPPK